MGNHTCLYYDSEKSLLEMVSCFFDQGLRSNALCLWVMPSSLKVEVAKAALRNKIKDLDTYIEKHQLELLSPEDVYLKGGVFNPDDALAFYGNKETDALSRSYSGLYVSGDASWLDKKDWEKLVNYEKEADRWISQSTITALCTYPSHKFDASHLFSLSFSHNLIIKGSEGKTDILINKRDIFK